MHGYLPRLRKANITVEENIGHIIDDGETRFYHTSDCIGFPNEYTCDVLALPVNNHWVCFGPYDGAEFAVETEARLIIPIHYDNPALPANMEEVEKELKERKLKCQIRDMGQSIEA